jgi:hypothetical protein
MHLKRTLDNRFADTERHRLCVISLAVPYIGGRMATEILIPAVCARRMERSAMKRVLFLGLLLCGFAVGAKAQAVDTDVCAIVKNPTAFDGKIVRIKGIAVAGYDEFIIKAADVCGFPVDGIWLEYPTGTKGKAGAVALVTAMPAKNYSGPYKAPTRTPVVLDKNNKDFKTFDSALAAPRKGPGMCLGCFKSTVSATFVGRLDAVANVAIKRDASGKVTDFGGFGNANAYPARLVLQSVADVTPKDIDYSKLDDIFKGMKPGFGGPGGMNMSQNGMFDAVAKAQELAKSMVGVPAGETVQKDVAVFPKSGEHNGVVVSYSATNELPKDEVAQKDSPDGVQYTAFLNLDRLDNSSQTLSIIHLGHHIADMKTPAPGGEAAPMFIGEYNAWTMTVLGGVMSGQKTIGLPGGDLLWNGAWPEGERNTKIDEALRDFLAKTAALSQ